MNGRTITTENLLAVLPAVLQRDPETAALAELLAQALAGRLEEVGRLKIYPAAGSLDEELLDLLARDFKVDWWDPDDNLERKRRTLETSWQVHRLLGTKAAVEIAASAVYPETRVYEWFEYGGKPYRFRLDVDLPEDGWTPERHKRLMRRLQYYKNLRSHMDSVTYRMHPVVLENRQALWFAALWVRLRMRTGERLALERLRVLAGVRERLGSGLGLTLRGGAGASVRLAEAAAFAQLLIHLRGSNFPPGPILLDGRRRLDGSWRLNQGMIRGPSMVSVRTSLAGKNRLAAGAAVTEKAMWRLDGTYRLNGRKKLNAGSRRSEL